VLKRARTAFESETGLFQIALDLADDGRILSPDGRPFTDTPSLLAKIEEVGWRLEHAAFVFVQTSQDTRDKFLGNGQKDEIQGRLRGIYVFRRHVADTT
jgi:hypothetical protein